MISIAFMIYFVIDALFMDASKNSEQQRAEQQKLENQKIWAQQKSESEKQKRDLIENLARSLDIKAPTSWSDHYFLFEKDDSYVPPYLAKNDLFSSNVLDAFAKGLLPKEAFLLFGKGPRWKHSLVPALLNQQITWNTAYRLANEGPWLGMSKDEAFLLWGKCHDISTKASKTKVVEILTWYGTNRNNQRIIVVRAHFDSDKLTKWEENT